MKLTKVPNQCKIATMISRRKTPKYREGKILEGGCSCYNIGNTLVELQLFVWTLSVKSMSKSYRRIVRFFDHHGFNTKLELKI